MKVALQAHVFFAMMLCGAALGMVYDMLALLRRLLHAGCAMTGFLDLFFGAACAAGIIAAGLGLETEVFRWYVFAGVLLGMAVYGCTAGRIARLIIRSFAEMSKKVKK